MTLNPHSEWKLFPHLQAKLHPCLSRTLNALFLLVFTPLLSKHERELSGVLTQMVCEVHISSFTLHQSPAHKSYLAHDMNDMETIKMFTASASFKTY